MIVRRERKTVTRDLTLDLSIDIGVVEENGWIGGEKLKVV